MRGPTKPSSKPSLNFPPGVPPPPAYLDAFARREYRRVTALLGAVPNHLQQVDMSVLATYAQAYSDVCRLTKEVRVEGETLVSELKGTSYLNPKCSALSAAHNRLRESAAKLAFSPLDRVRAGTKPAASGVPTANPLSGFLNTP